MKGTLGVKNNSDCIKMSTGKNFDNFSRPPPLIFIYFVNNQTFGCKFSIGSKFI